MRKLLSFLICALLSISFASIFSTTAAIAHSGVVSSNPAAGEVLTELPDEISVTFSEELLVLEGKAVNTLTLTAQDATQVPLTDISVEGNFLRASVPAGDFPAGLYEMNYRVISADGHEISDVIAFSLNTAISLDTSMASPASSASPEVVKSESQPFALPVPIVLAIVLLIVAGGFYLLARRRRAN
jgi:methionine-rich copper-binding protein CopC